MATHLPAGPDAPVGELLRGIIEDAQTLVSQQLTLFKTELKSDLTRTREVATSLALAVGVGMVGAFLLGFMLVHLLFELTAPRLSLWACYGIVAAALLAISGLVAFAQYRRLRSQSILPEKSVQALEENLEWKTKPR